MNYDKLDGALVAATEGAADVDTADLVVFVHVESGVRTATLSARQVEELSEQPWVRFLRLAQRLRLAEDG